MTEETPAEHALLQTTSSWLERAIGVVAIVVGMLLTSFVLTLGRPLLTGQRPLSVGILALLAVVFVFTLFFVTAGLRLTFQLPNRQGALFAPWVWFAISAVLLVTSAVFIVVGVKQSTFDTAQGLLSALLLSLLSYGAGSHFRRKARERVSSPGESHP